MGDDPIGVYLPSGCLLLLQTLVGFLAYRLWPVAEQSPTLFLGGVASLVLVRGLLAAPLRAAIVGAGARSLELHWPPRWLWVRIGHLLLVHTVVVAVQLVGALALVSLGIAAAAWFLGHGWLVLPTGFLFAGAVAAAALAVVVEGLFGYAPAEALLHGCSAPVSLWRSATRGWGDLGAAVVFHGIGGGIVALGALACGAGALPGYPFGDLAVLAHWYTRDQQGANNP